MGEEAGLIAKPDEKREVLWARIEATDLVNAVSERLESGARFAGLVGEVVGKDHLLHTLVADDPAVGKPAGPHTVLTCRLHGNPPSFPALVGLSPAAAVFEREVRDRFGFISEGYDAPPLLLPESVATEHTLREAVLPQVDAPGAFQLSVGPVRSGVEESQQFLFETVGEEMFHLTVQLYYKYRGVEVACEGRSVDGALPLVERLSGRSSFAHSLAFCQAIERICRIDVPSRALYLRSLFAELERLYNHFHDMGELCKSTTLQVLEAQWFWLKEQVLRLNTQIGVTRYLRNINTVGGVLHDLSDSGSRLLMETLPGLTDQYWACTNLANRTYSHVQRLEATGTLSDQAVRDFACVGPVARACGLRRDARRDHPYAAYGHLEWRMAHSSGGDALARMQVRLQEIEQSLAIVRQCVAWLSRHAGPILREATDGYPTGTALGWSETPRGEAIHFVRLSEEGTIARVKFRTPSLVNWQPFPLTIAGIMMPDFAVNKASWNLSVAGNDQ